MSGFGNLCRAADKKKTVRAELLARIAWNKRGGAFGLRLTPETKLLPSPVGGIL